MTMFNTYGDFLSSRTILDAIKAVELDKDITKCDQIFSFHLLVCFQLRPHIITVYSIDPSLM